MLGCNNYEIVDLGVMVSCERILQTAIDEKVDIIGLSGLITPSLDEMVHVAKEMQRLGFTIPLLIGGATTSKAHTAVKIEQNYRNNATVYVPDASRSVTVVSRLLSEDGAPEFKRKIHEEYDAVRARNANRDNRKNMLSFEMANKNAFKADWDNYFAVTPAFLGNRVFDDYSLDKIIPYIDWTPFFITWSLAGKYPAILNDEVVGEAARDLFRDAQAMLREIVQHKLLKAQAVVGFWPAAQLGVNDVGLYSDDERVTLIARFNFLRQQSIKAEGIPNLCLSDFIAPLDIGKPDYFGGFAVTTGIGADALSKKYEQQNNDYSALLVKALADRLAEAFAEHMHQRVRTEFWPYASSEQCSNEERIREQYRGIRPAPGYPACPEHSDKEILFELLEVPEQIGMSLTESYAMSPAASVSGFYFSHPEARYFAVGKIDSDQVQSMAERKGVSFEEMSRLLSPILA